MTARSPRMLALTGASAIAISVAAQGHAQDGAGFSISIDGQTVAGDPRLSTPKAREDRVLERAKLRVQFDGLEVEPRLNAIITNERTPRAGDVMQVRSQMNYPAYVTRGEIRVIDTAARGGPRVVATAPIDANGDASVRLPQSEDNGLVMVYRVYDAQGRFDETRPLPIRPIDVVGDTDLDAPPPELGEDAGGIRRIPVYGGAVTVSGSDVRRGAVVNTLGEEVRPDPDGTFVLQRILPAGDQSVIVQVDGAGEDTYVERDIFIPRAEWFYTGIIDLTAGRRLEGGVEGAGGEEYDRTFTYGRIAGYAKGKTQNGWILTGSVDTGEDDLSDLFRDLDEKDPYNVLLRLQREDAYPEYGDDSTFEEGAPTDGKFFLRAEKNGSHIMWGNYKATVSGGYYLRNERTLYGAQGVYRSPQTTTRGQSQVSVEAYAANPDNLPGRDTFLGTGGSVYFLQRQDISVDTETLSIKLRDRDSGRVVDSRTLVAGRDYRINYLQGTIVLTEPLSGSAAAGTVVTQPGGEYDVLLVANYEYTPAVGDVDGYSYGGRAEAWVSDTVRLGYTGIVEQTDIADQTAQSVDLLYELSERSFLELEYAETEGPGFGSTFSADGGLIVESDPSAGVEDGTGSAYAARVQVDFADVGLQTPGTFAAYFERRDAGFSSLDYETRVDEELWGVSVDIEASERLAYRLYFDSFEDDDGARKREGGAELTYLLSDRVRLDFGAEHLDRNEPGGDDDENGSRTDVAVRATFTESDDFAWYVYGQGTIERSGGLEENNRAGVGVRYRFAEHWTFEGEVSEGSLGSAGTALLTYEKDENNSTYFGYKLDPGREFSGADLVGRDRGQYVVGGRRRLHEDVDVYAENTYDLFGNYKALTSTYGVEYRTTEALTLSSSFEYGEIRDFDNGDFDRKALSLGLRYESENGLSARARAEFRRDRGETSGTNRDSDAFLFVSSARYKIDERQRVLLSLDYADTDTDNSSLLTGEYVDAQVGYAFRPVDNDRLNVLFKYRYLRDSIGQELDGTTERGPRQKSHVLSLDADYDLNETWTIGGKIGGRWGESAPDEDIALADNDAYLAVVNARYHLTHKWDLLVEGRYLEATDAELKEYGVLGAVYRHVGQNVKLGIGYNSGRFFRRSDGFDL
ncbi:hypothetical protein [Sulfitobacter sp. S190]|uniref:hypothetical protein n=1 Tax=Sulfitobacter sp. S190 TaxID=2867022 RepID=UPI0021A391D4|nr:hypothetical protein [Sulfitobacter sp. S190]UWR24548.1 hypothetical protein K3756_18740 [Sulfitobacter sp. S190]